MKNFMPNLSEKSSTSFILARSPQQHHSALTLGGKLVSFIFAGLKSWSEQGTLMVAKDWREEEEGEKHWYIRTNRLQKRVDKREGPA
jgi:hypothetical protein